MNLQSLFQDFNPSKFLVYSCLLIFTLLFALRLDGAISWSYWAIFLPLWIWKAFVISGASTGSYIWWQHPQYRIEGEGYVHYKAMLISLALQLLLLMFELLVCDKLENSRHLWILVFIPLIFISVVSVAVCIWAVKHDRSFEMELFCSVNILQFIFLALRLDDFIVWNWVVVFVPLWIVMCLAVIGVLYAIIFASILLRTPEVGPEQRRTSIHSAISYSMIVVPLLIFLVLLSNKLDRGSSLSYTATCIPLFFTFVVLILLSFGSKGGNHWWFGIRKDFCQFLLGVCPLLQEYGNISYSLHSNEPEENEPSERTTMSRKPQYIHSKKKTHLTQSEIRAVVPALSIEMPD
ncbi:transmembrane protein 185A-like [Centruroides sculpturatus]|uniref:transmembrane protein 185A-like n=2 Tax=Centruroides sculpturatus TaxID=218467 RepID=UPI000C6D378C|nr:transmembrane protein 185A-like [Centruroides sculpturatus]